VYILYTWQAGVINYLMDSPRKKFSFRKVPAWITAGIICLLYCLLLYRGFTPAQINFENDISQSFSVGKLALEGHNILLGPPSHLGGRHLSPVYYWFTAFAELLARGNTYYTIIIMSLYQLIALALSIYLATHFVAKKLRPLVIIFAILSVLAPHYLFEIRCPWHGTFIILPAAIFFFSFYRALKVGWPGVCFMLFAASFLFLTHYGTLPLVLGCSTVVAWRIFKVSPDNTSKGVFSAQRVLYSLSPFTTSSLWLFLTIILWLPLLYYELHYRSIIYELYRALHGSSPPRASIKEAAITLYHFAAMHWLIPLEYPFDSLIAPLAAIIAFLYFIAFIFFVLKSEQTIKLFFIGIFISLIFSFMSLVNAPRPLFMYYLNSYLPLLPIMFGTVCAYYGSILAETYSLRERSKYKNSKSEICAHIAAACFIGIFILNVVTKCRIISLNIKIKASETRILF
jgi:hypothetical protein